MSNLSPRDLFSKACHAMWCEAMELDGWTYGLRLDEKAKTHPSLVPFQQLDLLDRRVAHVASSGLARSVLDEFDMNRERGTNREFTAAEMHEGLRVMFRRWGEDELATPVYTGTVIGWELDDDPRFLRTIRVRWDDGDVKEYVPTEYELSRLAEIDPKAAAAHLPHG